MPERSDDKISLMGAIYRRGVVHWWKMNYCAVLSDSERLIEINQTISETSPVIKSLIFNAYHLHAMVQYARGEAVKALQEAHDLYNNYFQGANVFDRLRILYLDGYANLISAKYGDCQSAINETLEIVHAIENTFAEEIVLNIISRAEVLQGQLDAAYQHANHALKLGENNNTNYTIVNANIVLGDIAYHLENFDKALHHYRTAQIREGFSTRSIRTEDNDIRLARVLIKTGRYAEAVERLKTVLESAEKRSMNLHQTQALILLGECALEEGDYQSAQQHFSKAFEIAKSQGLKYECLWAKIDSAKLAFSRHQYDSLGQTLAELREESQSLNTPWLTLEILALTAQWVKALEKDDAPREAIGTFNAVVIELDNHTLSDPLRQDFLQASQIWKDNCRTP